MVNGTDPTVPYKDFLALIKLDHVIAGIYIWETVFTAGFELDVLRREQPYRWTIWLYLGTRYTALLTFILILIDEDGGEVSCQPFATASAVFIYASWAFASLIIVLRVIAIWNRKRLVSCISISVWLVGNAINLYSLTLLKGDNTFQGTCRVIGSRKFLSSAVGILVVDTVLFMSMLIGLLRYAHRSSTGIWYLLYQQCIIWIALACIAEMFIDAGIAILSIGAARLHRSLCQRGSLTEYVASELPPFPLGRPISNVQYRAANVHSSIHFAAAAQSNGIVSTSESPVFVPKDPIQLRFVSGRSSPKLVHGNTKDKVEYNLETA
ncbi:hypothetical protein BJV78DRAFT_194666 [Lactifluus subvellereus]|nr:hypothetical protein BJV78DRAFT_194666 [Lactifluus subvellereus]